MKTAMLVVALLTAGIVLLVVFLPNERSAKKSAVIKASPDKVFAVVTNLSDQRWRSHVKQIQILDASPGKEIWIEKTHRGPELKFRTRLKSAPNRFEIEIIDNPSFGGYWTGVFSAYGNSETTIEFSEHVVVSGIFPKLMSHLFFDVSESVETYIDDLRKAVE
jgi:hypothetical protein